MQPESLNDKTRKLYIDCAPWQTVRVDDFLVAVGEKQSNSVYHVAEVKQVVQKNKRITRHYMQVYKSDLMTALKRDRNTQQLIPLKWYKREKKKL